MVTIMHNLHKSHDIPTQIKNPDLVRRRRRQIIDAAVDLFIDNGFHKTTTRQIARAAGLSIGALYEYVASKEDVLYLVCDSIHTEIENRMSDVLDRTTGGENVLSEVIREYFMVCNRMSDFILLIYQETQSLPSQWQKKVLENELRITGLFIKVLGSLVSSKKLPYLDDRLVELVAHNISVLGHMWIFRRWFLANNYDIEEYIELQTEFILGIFAQKTKPVSRLRRKDDC